MRMVVVLPEPFGPSRPITSPALTSNDRSSTAVNSPKRFDNPITWSTGSPGCAFDPSVGLPIDPSAG